jgi:hypothetical protein
MRPLIFLVALAGSALMAESVDISGTWTGEMRQKQQSGDVAHIALVFELTQTDGVVTGTAGPSEHSENPIHDARLDGDRLTFTVSPLAADGGESSPTWKFQLKVSNTRMDGTAEGSYRNRSLGSTEVVMSRSK